MTKDKMERAEEEATRFLVALGRARLRLKSDQEYDSSYFSASKEVGAMKRASMDLTRALTELRHS